MQANHESIFCFSSQEKKTDLNKTFYHERVENEGGGDIILDLPFSVHHASNLLVEMFLNEHCLI